MRRRGNTLNDNKRGMHIGAVRLWIGKQRVGLISQGIMVAAYLIMSWTTVAFPSEYGKEIIIYMYLMWPILLLVLSVVTGFDRNSTLFFPVLSTLLGTIVVEMVQVSQGILVGDGPSAPDWGLLLVLTPIYAFASFGGYGLGRLLHRMTERFVGGHMVASAEDASAKDT